MERPRCSFAADRCAREDPALEEVGPGHQSACFERNRLARMLKVAS